MAVQASKLDIDGTRPAPSRGAKVLLFLVCTGLLIGIHLGVFSQSELFDGWSVRLTGHKYGVSLYAGVVVFSLFTLIFLVVCLAPRAVKYDPEVHNIIYYLGFMSTLASLIISSYALLTGPEAQARNATDLVAQNGLALVATFSGIFYRNLLRYWFPPRPENLLARWEDLQRTISSVDDGLKALTTQAEQFQKVFASATAQIESGKTHWEQMTAITGAMDQSFQASSASARQLNGSIAQSSAVNQQLANAVAQSAQTVRTLSAEVERLSQRMSVAGQAEASTRDVRPLRSAAGARR